MNSFYTCWDPGKICSNQSYCLAFGLSYGEKCFCLVKKYQNLIGLCCKIFYRMDPQEIEIEVEVWPHEVQKRFVMIFLAVAEK